MLAGVILTAEGAYIRDARKEKAALCRWVEEKFGCVEQEQERSQPRHTSVNKPRVYGVESTRNKQVVIL
jgi:hypothetical protein